MKTYYYKLISTPDMKGEIVEDLGIFYRKTGNRIEVYDLDILNPTWTKKWMLCKWDSIKDNVLYVSKRSKEEKYKSKGRLVAWPMRWLVRKISRDQLFLELL